MEQQKSPTHSSYGSMDKTHTRSSQKAFQPSSCTLYTQHRQLLLEVQASSLYAFLCLHWKFQCPGISTCCNLCCNRNWGCTFTNGLLWPFRGLRLCRIMNCSLSAWLLQFWSCQNQSNLGDCSSCLFECCLCLLLDHSFCTRSLGNISGFHKDVDLIIITADFQVQLSNIDPNKALKVSLPQISNLNKLHKHSW